MYLFEIILLGDGKLKASFEKEIHSKGLTKYFTLPGFKNNVDGHC